MALWIPEDVQEHWPVAWQKIQHDNEPKDTRSTSQDGKKINWTDLNPMFNDYNSSAVLKTDRWSKITLQQRQKNQLSQEVVECFSIIIYAKEDGDKEKMWK